MAGAGEQKQGQENVGKRGVERGRAKKQGAIGVKPEGAGQSEGASGKAWDSKGPSNTAGATMNKINWHAQRCARRQVPKGTKKP